MSTPSTNMGGIMKPQQEDLVHTFRSAVYVHPLLREAEWEFFQGEPLTERRFAKIMLKAMTEVWEKARWN
jgi:hypothetical protein